MPDGAPSAVESTPLDDAVRAAFTAPVALLALGIPACPSCELLKVTLGAVAWSRPDLMVVFSAMDSQSDWDRREELLWPRGVHVSRASVPALVVVRDGAVIASRQGGGPASAIDQWIAGHLGPAERELGSGVTASEHEALAGMADVRARFLAAKAARPGVG